MEIIALAHFPSLRIEWDWGSCWLFYLKGFIFMAAKQPLMNHILQFDATIYNIRLCLFFLLLISIGIWLINCKTTTTRLVLCVHICRSEFLKKRLPICWVVVFILNDDLAQLFSKLWDHLLVLGNVQKYSILVVIPILWLRYWFLNETFFDTNFMKQNKNYDLMTQIFLFTCLPQLPEPRLCVT